MTEIANFIDNPTESERTKITPVLSDLRPEYQQRYLEEYKTIRLDPAITREKAEKGGWYGAHMYYLGSGCIGFLYTITLGGFILGYLYDVKAKGRLEKLTELGNAVNIEKLASVFRRRESLKERFDSEEVIDLILGKKFATGMPAEALIESIGKPSKIDHQVMKTKTREVWKYQPMGQNRYKLKITLDNGYITGWDHKSS